MKLSHIRRLGMLTAALGLLGCTEPNEPVGPRLFAESVSQSQATTYSGDATVVQAKVLNLQPIRLVEAGPLPESGGADKASLLTVQIPSDATGGLLELTAVVAHATTVGRGNASRSEASVAKLQMAVSGNVVSAEFLHARAEATCQAGNATASGGSELASLVINGQAIVVSGEPNQTVALEGLKVVINEQTGGASGNTADMTVNALHLSAFDPLGQPLADVIISQAHADISCAAPPQPPPTEPVCQDFVTGGGRITVTPSGAKGNFGVAGGYKNGALWGHLTYIDHGPGGPKVKGIEVTAYGGSGTTRHIEGTAEVDGTGGFTYMVDVTDDGEPGRNDMFTISVPELSGYTASGTLGGGNIQLHKPCDEAPPT